MSLPSVTWSTLKAQVKRKLDDADGDRYSDDLLLDAVNDALEAFASTHTGLASDFTITGNGTDDEFDLPPHIVDSEEAGVYAVHWEFHTWLEELEYLPGTAWPQTEKTTTSDPLGYVLWPAGKITFSRKPKSDQVVTVHYVAHYPRVTGDSSEINVPRWAREPIKLYTAALALEPASTKAGVLGQYKSRREAGDPEDNPVLQLARHFMKRYGAILHAHRPPQYSLAVPHDRTPHG